VIATVEEAAQRVGSRVLAKLSAGGRMMPGTLVELIGKKHAKIKLDGKHNHFETVSLANVSLWEKGNAVAKQVAEAQKRNRTGQPNGTAGQYVVVCEDTRKFWGAGREMVSDFNEARVFPSTAGAAIAAGRLNHKSDGPRRSQKLRVVTHADAFALWQSWRSNPHVEPEIMGSDEIDPPSPYAPVSDGQQRLALPEPATDSPSPIAFPVRPVETERVQETPAQSASNATPTRAGGIEADDAIMLNWIKARTSKAEAECLLLDAQKGEVTALAELEVLLMKRRFDSHTKLA
jgi:hypothetical protein